MDVVEGLQALPEVQLHARFWEIRFAVSNEFVDVHVHQLEHQCQAPCRLITARAAMMDSMRWTPHKRKDILEHFKEANDVRVGLQSPQCLDLTQVVHLLNAFEVVLHAFDGAILACLQGLCFDHLTKRSLAFRTKGKRRKESRRRSKEKPLTKQKKASLSSKSDDTLRASTHKQFVRINKR